VFFFFVFEFLVEVVEDVFGAGDFFCWDEGLDSSFCDFVDC